MEFTELTDIDISKVEAYRGNSGYTTIYLEDGKEVCVKEDFETVDNFLED